MARRQKKYHYIYKTTCNITGRYYIGMHSTDNLEDDYIGSGKRLWYSFKKYGKENHIKEILEFLPDRKSLKEREAEIVNIELLGEEMCMNLVVGGEGGFISLEGVKKGGEITYRDYGDKFNEWGKKGGKTNIQKNGYGVLLENWCDWTGRKHSSETKEKISKTMKGRYDGKNNPSYGTCWITKEGINKKIKKEEIDTYLTEGWLKGRKLK
jgi:hypothetical protein